MRIILAFIFLLLSGCGYGLAFITPADRDLNDQTKKAGKLVYDKETNPTLKQAGKDIVENCETMEKNVFGHAINPKEYSPEESKGCRAASESEHNLSFWEQYVVPLKDDIPYGAIVIALGTALVGWLRARRNGKICDSMIEAVDDASEELPAESKKVLVGQLEKKAVKYHVGQEASEKVRGVRKKRGKTKNA